VLRDQTDPDDRYATCVVADVARGVPGIEAERIRYLRISRRPQWPYSNRYGGERYEPDAKAADVMNWTPARVIGTVPIEADGSAYFRVPAGEAVYFQLLDENQMELRRMRSFISFQPGEHRGCVGCHETREEVGAADRFPRAMLCEPRTPVPPPWGTRPISFPRDVQPVLDRHCAGCHAGLKPAGGLDFSAGLTERHNRAFDTINAHGLVSRSNIREDARITMPLEFGSHRSKLVAVLRDGACANRAKLGEEDWLRLVTWIDANGPYHDGFINKRAEEPPYNLATDAELVGRIAAVHARRCAECHPPAEVTRADWIDLGRPERSRFLVAPLAEVSETANSRPKCAKAVYPNRDDPDYQAVLELVRTAVRRAWSAPRRDLRGLLPRG
jgi:mono/diheme cytochrome c family protein